METTRSADGTVIAYERAGDGPPLVVAVGAFCDRKTFVPPTAAAIGGARLTMVPGHDHMVPAEVIAPVLADFFLGPGA